jgi:hypothetical protein
MKHLFLLFTLFTILVFNSQSLVFCQGNDNLISDSVQVETTSYIENDIWFHSSNKVISEITESEFLAEKKKLQASNNYKTIDFHSLSPEERPIALVDVQKYISSLNLSDIIEVRPYSRYDNGEFIKDDMFLVFLFKAKSGVIQSYVNTMDLMNINEFFSDLGVLSFSAYWFEGPEKVFFFDVNEGYLFNGIGKTICLSDNLFISVSDLNVFTNMSMLPPNERISVVDIDGNMTHIINLDEFTRNLNSIESEKDQRWTISDAFAFSNKQNKTLNIELSYGHIEPNNESFKNVVDKKQFYQIVFDSSMNY